MIGRTNRFHGHGSLRYVYQHGQTVRGPQLAFRFVLNERRRSYRAAVVVSKKVSKSAVVRNRIRRRIYEIIRLNATSVTKPYDMVVTVFSEEVATMPADELRAIIEKLLRQSRVLERAPKATHAIINKKEF